MRLQSKFNQFLHAQLPAVFVLNLVQQLLGGGKPASQQYMCLRPLGYASARNGCRGKDVPLDDRHRTPVPGEGRPGS